MLLTLTDVNGNCGFANLTALNAPKLFKADMVDGDFVNEAESVNLTCIGTNEYLDPPAENNELALICNADGTFTAPASWPSCKIRCPVLDPDPSSGFALPDGIRCFSNFWSLARELSKAYQ